MLAALLSVALMVVGSTNALRLYGLVANEPHRNQRHASPAFDPTFDDIEKLPKIAPVLPTDLNLLNFNGEELEALPPKTAALGGVTPLDRVPQFDDSGVPPRFGARPINFRRIDTAFESQPLQFQLPAFPTYFRPLNSARLVNQRFGRPSTTTTTRRPTTTAAPSTAATSSESLIGFNTVPLDGIDFRHISTARAVQNAESRKRAVRESISSWLAAPTGHLQNPAARRRLLSNLLFVLEEGYLRPSELVALLGGREVAEDSTHRRRLTLPSSLLYVIENGKLLPSRPKQDPSDESSTPSGLVSEAANGRYVYPIDSTLNRELFKILNDEIEHEEKATVEQRRRRFRALHSATTYREEVEKARQQQLSVPLVATNPARMARLAMYSLSAGVPYVPKEDNNHHAWAPYKANANY